MKGVIGINLDGEALDIVKREEERCKKDGAKFNLSFFVRSCIKKWDEINKYG